MLFPTEKGEEYSGHELLNRVELITSCNTLIYALDMGELITLTVARKYRIEVNNITKCISFALIPVTQNFTYCILSVYM